MTAFPLLAVSLIMKVVTVLFVISAVVLVLLILIQKGKGGGLTGALGGGGAGGLLGTKTGDFLTWFTIGIAVVVMLLLVLMAKFYKPTTGDYGSGVAQQIESPAEQQVPLEAPLVSEVPGETGAVEDVNPGGE